MKYKLQVLGGLFFLLFSPILALYIGAYEMFFKGIQYIIQAFEMHSIMLILGVVFFNLIRISLSCFVSLLIIGIGWSIGFCIVDYGN